jgi:hypothetical protein
MWKTGRLVSLGVRLALLIMLLGASIHGAESSPRRLLQLPKSSSAQVFLDGVLQAATLDSSCETSTTCGGTLKVNGETVIVPKNLMVFFPAYSATWQEIFTNGRTGLALTDNPRASFTVSVAANRVNNQIIAALVDIGQSPILSGAGYIDSIDYNAGELVIEANDGPGSGAKVRLNDPLGRFGIIQNGSGFDERFQVDADNPTVAAATGFPMCIPRTDPRVGSDPECPSSNRPLGANNIPLTAFTMSQPGGQTLDPMKMAPFMVGDYVEFAGILSPDGFIAAYGLSNNVAIYTLPGRDPAYTNFEAAIIATGGANVLGAGEAAVRARFEGFTTDSSRPVQLWALDFKADGTYTKRNYGQVMPDPGPPNGAVKGRWRFRPDCTVNGSLTTASQFLGNKGCTPPDGGVYTPAPREVMVDITGCTPVEGAANGVTSGDGPGAGCMYRNPAIEYIWPENVPGAPIVPNNFAALQFLTRGGYTSNKGTKVGTLNPWPGVDLCGGPTITINDPFFVTQGGSVTLQATVTGPGTYSFLWTADAVAGGTTTDATSLTPTFTGVTDSTTYTLTVTNDFCKSSFTTKASVSVVSTIVCKAIPSLQVPQGTANVQITASLSGTVPATMYWTAPATINIIRQQPAAATASLTSSIFFNAPAIAAGSVDPIILNFSVRPGPAGNTQNSPCSAMVTVKPPPDRLTVTTLDFRCDKHRLIISVTSSIPITEVTNPNYFLTLLQYRANDNTLFQPAVVGDKFIWNPVTATFDINIQPVPLPSTTLGLTISSSIGGLVRTGPLLSTQIKPSGKNPRCNI